MNFLLIQGVGLIGLAIIIISFQKDKKSFTLLSHLVAGFFFATHLILLDAWTGAAMCIIGSARAFVFYKRDTVKWLDNKIVMYIFVAVFVIAGILTWNSYFSILPIIAVSIECFALWSKKTNSLRWLFLSARPLWVIYNISVGSYSGIATEIFIISSLLVALFRFHKNKSKKSNDT